MTMELLLAVPVSVISAALVFYLTRMSGSFVFFWAAYLVTIYVGIGAPLPESMLLCAHARAAHACTFCMHCVSAQHAVTCGTCMHIAGAGHCML